MAWAGSGGDDDTFDVFMGVIDLVETDEDGNVKVLGGQYLEPARKKQVKKWSRCVDAASHKPWCFRVFREFENGEQGPDQV